MEPYNGFIIYQNYTFWKYFGKYKQKFKFYLHFHISKWLQKVLFLTNFEVCLNVINTVLQDLMYWVLLVPIFHILQQILYCI
jgi:hypothetical protein